jgi:glucokinase
MEKDEYDIFISYSSRDAGTARLLHEYLTEMSYQVWLDKIEVIAGDDIIQKVFDGIKKSRFFVILLSRYSTQSKWVREELSAARIRELEEGKITILPILYEDCKVPESLTSKKYIDFRHSIQQGLEDLKADLGIHHQRENREEIQNPSQKPEKQTLGQTKSTLLNAISGNEELYMVMDLGGTKAYVSLVDREANRLFDRKFSTESHGDSDQLFNFIKSCIWGAIDGIHETCNITTDRIIKRINALGIAFAGPTDFERGLILDASNFQIQNFPLAEKLESMFGIPTFVDNDVNLGVLGESWKGVAKGYENVVGIIIGTGIGGGIIINGQIYRGKNKTAGEIGHMVLDFNSEERCGCGQLGCFEILASRRNMARKLTERKASIGQTDLIWSEDNLGSNDIAYYFKIGDPDAVEIVNDAATLCGKAVFTLLNLLNPDIIFFAGGFVRQLGDIFLEPVRVEAKKCMNAVYSLGDKHIPIVVGELDNPILVGACKMVIDNTVELKEYSKELIIETLVDGLSEVDFKRLYEFYKAEIPIPISKDPQSDFFETNLRVLRNRGLIRTEDGQSFRRSRTAKITDIGRIVVSETKRA